MLRMQYSGYNCKLRYEILKSAYEAYDRIKEKEMNEEVPMYRHKRYRRNERKKERKNKKVNWYKNGNTEAVMFIPATPNSELKKNMQLYIQNSGAKIKVIERSGKKIIRSLQKNDPFKEEECNDRESCLLCSTTQKGNCRATGIIYAIKCSEECPFVYHGQTSHNAYKRGLKHTEDLNQRRDRLWKHCHNEHGGEKQVFQMSIVNTCRNDPTKRQILESIHIQNTDSRVTMNERAEWNGVRVPRIRFE